MEAWIDGRIVAVPYFEESLTLRSYFVDAARGVLPERQDAEKHKNSRRMLSANFK